MLYETRPDIAPTGYDTTIKNDETAQLLCAIFNEWPWLAIKKNTLFEAENHPQVFSERIHAHHVVFADRVKAAVQACKEKFPSAYRSSWLLTRLVACYLVGQLIREDECVGNLLVASRTELEDRAVVARLAELAELAAVSLRQRHESLGDADDFKSAFKNEKHLLEMAAAARTVYRLSMMLQEQQKDT